MTAAGWAVGLGQCEAAQGMAKPDVGPSPHQASACLVPQFPHL